MEDKTFQPGIVLDEKFIKHIESAYKFDEFVTAAAPVSWTEKERSAWRRFPIYNQDGSGSCVAQTMRKLLHILWKQRTGEELDFSASDIYQRRVNKPSGGMGGDDVFRIAREGVALNSSMPSDNMNDTQMDSVAVTQQALLERSRYKVDAWMMLPIRDIETLASTIQQTGKGVMIWTFWNHDEWLDVPVIKRSMDLYAQSTSRHSTAGVDLTLIGASNMPNNPELWGKKAIIMDESWDKVATALDGQRLLTEDFLKVRNFYAAYPISFKLIDQQTPKPKHWFNTSRILKYRPLLPVVKGDKDVIALQDILKFEGLFPINVDSTGYFGTYTKTALAKWQAKHFLKPDGIAGIKTLTKLNQLYA